MDAETKVCKKCGNEYPLTEEYWARYKKGGKFAARCKACDSAYFAEWYAKNKQEWNDKRAAKHAANRDEDNAKLRAYRAEHRERRRASGRKYRAANRERLNQISREYAAANRERLKRIAMLQRQIDSLKELMRKDGNTEWV
jgi:hypothetical protein